MRKHFMMITKEGEAGRALLLPSPLTVREKKQQPVAGLPGYHTEIFLRQFCLSCCLAFSCVVTFSRGNAWLAFRFLLCPFSCHIANPSELESQRCWQFPLDELRKHTKLKLLRKTLNAMLSVPRFQFQFKHQGLSLSSQFSVLNSQFSSVLSSPAP